MIRPGGAEDAGAIARIYNHYVTESTITFEEQPLAADEIALRMADVQAGGFPWLVAVQDGAIVGYAYANKWKTRNAYRFCVESAIYLTPSAVGRGIGHSLYRTLIEQLRDRRLHAVIGVIALPNPSSVALHEKLGFRKAGHFPEVGFKFGHWIDVGYWQLLL